ncbi:MAG: class I SAM-dependent methyltransferase [Gammaproteobacteria bacterium]
MDDCPHCPDCGADHPKRIGRLPDVAFFAGRRTDSLVPGGALYRCATCALCFRWPRLAPSLLSTLYDNANVSVWREPEGTRQEWRMIGRMIEQLPLHRPRVLDVGCHTGDLLASLGVGVTAFGVEPNPHARAVAARHCAATWSSLDDIPPDVQFDVIVATDVLEHVEQPSAFLARLFELVTPKGEVILTTGDADAPLARLAGAHWWYWYLPEHLSFVSRDWFARLSAQAHIRVVNETQFAHSALQGGARLRGLMLALAYALLGPHYLALVARLYRRLGRTWQPMPHGQGVTRDHLLVALARP